MRGIRKALIIYVTRLGFSGGSVGEESACNAGDTSSVPGSERSLAGGHDDPLQDSCLENPMDRGAWHTVVHRVAKSRTQLRQLSSHTHTHITRLSRAVQLTEDKCRIVSLWSGRTFQREYLLKGKSVGFVLFCHLLACGAVLQRNNIS